MNMSSQSHESHFHRDRNSSDSLPHVSDFDYVVKKQDQTKLAFGSMLSRTVMPMAKLRGGANRLGNLATRATDSLQHLGPAEYAYHRAVSKVMSTRGMGPGARCAARFPETDRRLVPPPNAYQSTSVPPPKPNTAPFNSNSQRKGFDSSTVPGPGSYGRLAGGAWRGAGRGPVVVRCGAGDGPGVCDACGLVLPEGVEFWAPGPQPGPLGRVVLCPPCMRAMRAAKRGEAKYNRWQLQAFQKTRDCSDIHRHEGTTAKIYLVHPAVVRKQRHREAYLARFFPDLEVIDRDAMPDTTPAKLVETDITTRSPIVKDEKCCIHQALHSFNREKMSFGFGSHNFSGPYSALNLGDRAKLDCCVHQALNSLNKDKMSFGFGSHNFSIPYSSMNLSDRVKTTG